MSAESFSDTVLNDTKRRLKKITVNDAQIAQQMFEELMGKEVEPRKDFLIKYGSQANID